MLEMTLISGEALEELVQHKNSTWYRHLDTALGGMIHYGLTQFCPEMFEFYERMFKRRLQYIHNLGLNELCGHLTHIYAGISSAYQLRQLDRMERERRNEQDDKF